MKQKIQLIRKKIEKLIIHEKNEDVHNIINIIKDALEENIKFPRVCIKYIYIRSGDREVGDS